MANVETKTLDIAWQTQEITPGLIQGNDALRIYNSLPEQLRKGLRYDEETKTVTGSTPFAVANLDLIARGYNARTPNLRDLSRPEVMRIAKGKHYIDSRNLVARSPKDPDWTRNDSLLRTIYELAEQKLGKIDGSFMIDGFSFIPNPEDSTGYGLTLVSNPDFSVVQDERLSGKHNGERFSKVDETGLPFFDGRGERTWYTRSKGLSRLFLGGDLGVGSNYGDLVDSGGVGRVVFLK